MTTGQITMINAFGVLGLVALGMTFLGGWGASGVLATCASFVTAKYLAS